MSDNITQIHCIKMDQVLLQIIMIDRCGTVHWWPFLILVHIWPCLFYDPCSFMALVKWACPFMALVHWPCSYMALVHWWPLFNELVHLWPLFNDLVYIWPCSFYGPCSMNLLLWPGCDVSVCVTLLHRSVINDGSPLGHLRLPKWSRYSWLWPTIQWPFLWPFQSGLDENVTCETNPYLAYKGCLKIA